MTTWNDFFIDEKNVEKAPEPEIYRFAVSLEKLFSERPLRLWDVCCGAGRHTIVLAGLGHEVYASDNASNAVRLTHEWLTKMKLQAHVELSEMTVCPWPKVTFHGVISWDTLYHNTLDNIRRAIDEIYARLVPGGLFMGTFKSIKSDSYSEGQEIESGTFIATTRQEEGIPHHYFDESGIRELFKKWELIILAEQVITYVERRKNLVEYNPFPYTTWGVLARK